MDSLSKIMVLDTVERMQSEILRNQLDLKMRLVDICDRMVLEKKNEPGYVKTTTHRILKRMVDDGLVEKDKKYYSITRKGRSFLSNNIQQLDPNHKWEPFAGKGLHGSFASIPFTGRLFEERRSKTPNMDRISLEAKTFFDLNQDVDILILRRERKDRK